MTAIWLNTMGRIWILSLSFYIVLRKTSFLKGQMMNTNALNYEIILISSNLCISVNETSDNYFSAECHFLLKK